MIKIGIDTYGGDIAPDANIQGAIRFVQEFGNKAEIVLVGDSEADKKAVQREGVDPSLFSFVHASEEITMSDHPVKAFASKKDSSIYKSFGLLKAGEIDAFCGTGNTGAMLVGAMQTVKAIPGIIRPCISSVLPVLNGGYSLILDVGSNADCKPDVLYQFGILGSVYAKEVHGSEKPKVALLNIGEEKEKGNLLTRATYGLMEESPDFEFIGNIEGSDLYTSKADVIVTDGFTGNVVLKQAEAFYSLAQARNIKDDYFDRFNYEEYGGTPILGVNAPVLIGHGKSSDQAVKKMLKLAVQVSEADLSEKIRSVVL